jgi:hypothetical protein
MTRFAPGIYHLVNIHGNDSYSYYINNNKFYIHNQTTVTVIVTDTLLMSPTANFWVTKIGQIGDIAGNATKWTD